MIPAIRHTDGFWRAFVNGCTQIVGSGPNPPLGFVEAPPPSDPHDFEITVDGDDQAAVVVSRTRTPRMDQAVIDDLLRRVP